MNTNVTRKSATTSHKVGEKYKCVAKGWGSDVGESVTITYIEHGCADYTTESGEKGLWGFEMFPNDFQLIEEKEEEEMDITSQKLFVNVEAYATNNKISLKQAHEEIQEWLFDKDFKWDSYEGVSFKDKTILVLNIDQPLRLCWESVDDITNLQRYTGIQELLIKRTCTVTLSPSIKEVFVEFNGKQYNKQKLEQALKMLENETAN